MVAPDSIINGERWVERYDRLLQASGLDREAILAQSLQAPAQDRRALFSLAQCLEQPELLVQQIRHDYPDANDHKAVRTYASVLQQDLALSVLAPLTLRLFRYGEAPVANPARIFLAPIEEAGQTVSRWFQAPGQPLASEQAFLQGMAAQTEAWYPVFRQQLGVSPGAYWSSIGLGLGAPFSAVWNLADPASVCDLAQQWLEGFRNDANRFVDWIPAVFGGQKTAIPQRKGCCLKYLLPEGGYCGTCGVYRKERMAALNRPDHCQAPDQWQPAR
ncbi:(2Fe-2S)-binding protein [Marinobacter pelagius]|uniref:FhuF 2Fe-2S C-terminal domain-containing protein n=1 Tax=Marinobacter pelagius TaxID=379482 RepID=A0A1I5AGW8_9GAMM|nr:(2Fe-2S)-binding protein [Marinobacter pelagius]SFN61459.1 FhuF 2Fe-2S C-terminal domain-containing protein [Marinobacter pelagius]